MSKHRVGVVVFCEAEGYDEHDAGAIAQILIRRLLSDHSHIDRETFEGKSVFWLELETAKGFLGPVAVHDVMDVGMAAGNGYLWTRPTSKAYPRSGEKEVSDGEADS